METLQRPYCDERRRLEELAAELDCAAPCSGSVSVLTGRVHTARTGPPIAESRMAGASVAVAAVRGFGFGALEVLGERVIPRLVPVRSSRSGLPAFTHGVGIEAIAAPHGAPDRRP